MKKRQKYQKLCAFGLFYDRIIFIEGSPFCFVKGVSIMSNKRKDNKGRDYITASISSQMVAIVLSIMMAPARKDIYTVGD